MLTCSQASSPSSTAPARHPRRSRRALRWTRRSRMTSRARFLYINIIREHARHAEHAGILRERSWTPRARPHDSTRPVATGNVSRQSPDAYQDQQRTASVFLCATLPRAQTSSPDSRPRCRSTATQSVTIPSARKRGSTMRSSSGPTSAFAAMTVVLPGQMSGRWWHSETEMGVLRGEQRPTGVQSRLCRLQDIPRRDGHLTEAVVHDARRRWQSRDRLRGPIGSPPGIAWPAGMLMARPGHSRKATARRTMKVAESL
jgi:hypothetical protein